MPADGVAGRQPRAKQPDTTRNSLAAPRSRSSSPTMAHRPRILFLARRYPPTIGGIQTHCHALYTRLGQPSPSPSRRAGPPVAFAPNLVPPLLLCGRLWGRARPPRRCRVLRRRGRRVVGSAPASFGSGAIRHHRLWPRNDLQKSPRARADALGESEPVTRSSSSANTAAALPLPAASPRPSWKSSI